MIIFVLQQLYWGQLCLECNKYCYPRDSKIIDYEEYIRRKKLAQKNFDEGRYELLEIVRRFGFYTCDCQECDHDWVSAWTWAIRYLEQVYFVFFMLDILSFYIFVFCFNCH